MISLSKTIFAVPPHLRRKLFSGEYERLGGVIREKSSGKIVYLLVDKLDEEKEGSSISVSMPEIMDSSIKYLTAGQIRRHLEYIEKELDTQNIQIKPEDLDLINEAIDMTHIKGISARQLDEIKGKMLGLYDRYHGIFSKYLNDLDRPGELQSFPFLKIPVLIAVTASRIWIQSKEFTGAREWISKVYDDILQAMKVYCVLNSKTDPDRSHYQKISRYPAGEFISELKEIITSPPDKPKYKFPPMEVIYLWNCLEYLDGYLLELEDMS
ncbi:MAG: hypothetical protein K6T66_08380 [Peptococcaceae bacterium]|nr:hypothetical protein [Peptococcaceae bacterium]